MNGLLSKTTYALKVYNPLLYGWVAYHQHRSVYSHDMINK